jgi:CubicO group peptidase (beta-lactamase class C family)
MAHNIDPMDERTYKGFDQYIQKSMQNWKINGASVAVVYDNQVVFTKGYGLRDSQKNLPVDAQTLFAIGSASKAFTTLSMGILVDRGLLEWDRPVRDYLPSFKLFDDFATQRMTPRDLVCHRSGLPRHDLMWYGTSLNRQELFDRLGFLEPNKDFRTTFQYQNLMFMAAGYLIEKISGLTWEEFVKKEVFAPLGMNRSNISVEDTKKDDNISQPYKLIKKQPVQVPFRNLDAIGPAGSINSTAEDMAKWVMLHLNDGVYGGQQVISKANIDQMHTPTTLITGAFFADLAKFEELTDNSYGLGWFMQNYRGHKIIHHGGHIDGFSSMVAFLPREKVGVVVLTNTDGSQYPFVPPFNVFDRVLGLPVIPWARRILDEDRRLELAAKKAKTQSNAERTLHTRPSHTLADYAGDYEHPAYGIVKMTITNGQLKAVYNGIPFEVKHYHYDTFEISNEMADFSMKVSFATDVRGQICSLSAPFEPNVKDIVFTRCADKKLTDIVYLGQLTGAYLLEGQKIIISLQGNHLVTAVPGQPVLDLEPYKDAYFTVKNAPAVSVEFRLTETGIVQSVNINQAGVIFSAEKVVNSDIPA